VGAAAAPAQDPAISSPPRPASLPPAQTQAAVQSLPAPPPVPAPYSPYYPYYPYGRMDPTYGYLEGAASVTNAQGQYLQQVQQARLMQSQADQSKLDLQRRINDERRYETEMTYQTNVRNRERDRANLLERSRSDAPGPEVWSGDALNTLLANIQQVQGQTGLRGPALPLDPGVLAHVNVMRPGDAAGVGVFRGDRLQWPFVLQDRRFAAERKRVDELVPQAVRYVAAGEPDAQRLRELLDAAAALKGRVEGLVRELTPTEYVQAMRFANQLERDARTLTRPGAENFFSGKWQARGGTVGELVDNMTREGLRFAPASAGQEGFYTTLHQQLAAYDINLAGLARR
jgi:hypothetical protein